jgi:hypothetical protein
MHVLASLCSDSKALTIFFPGSQGAENSDQRRHLCAPEVRAEEGQLRHS